MSQSTQHMKSILERRAERQAVAEGLVRCPFHPEHIIPSTSLLAHLQACHASEDLSFAAHAMYTRSAGGCRPETCAGQQRVAAFDCRRRNVGDEPSLCRTRSSRSTDSSDTLRTSSLSGSDAWSDHTEMSSSPSRQPSCSGYCERCRRPLGCADRALHHDATTQTPQPVLSYGTSHDSSSIGVLGHAVIPASSSVSLLPQPIAGSFSTTGAASVLPSPQKTFQASTNPLEEKTVLFRFAAALSECGARTHVLRTLSEHDTPAFSLVDDVADIITHQGTGLVVCRSVRAAIEVRELLSKVVAASLGGDDGRAGAPSTLITLL